MVAVNELLQPRVRWYEPEDVPSLVGIHAACLPREKWAAEDFRRFAGKAGRTNVLKVLADRTTNRPIGSLLYTLTEGVCNIRRIAVHPDHQRQGFGRLMVGALTGHGSPIRRRFFAARVREDYVSACLFFRNAVMGFHFDPELPRHIYRDGREGFLFCCQKPAAVRRVLVATH